MRRGRTIVGALLVAGLFFAAGCDGAPEARPPKDAQSGPGKPIHAGHDQGGSNGTEPPTTTANGATTTTVGGTTTSMANHDSTTTVAPPSTGGQATTTTRRSGGSSTTTAPDSTSTTSGPSQVPSTTVPPLTGKALFSESFSGSPNTPTPWKPGSWDVTVHSRDVDTFYELEPMQAMHGSNCSGPPATHAVSSYDDAVFLCRDHVMTAINASGYGVVYLTPDAMVDFSQGEATIRFDVSTLRSSLRDWIDLWITPYEDNLQLPLEEFYPDLNGPPRRAVHVFMSNFNGGTNFKAEVYNNFQRTEIDSNWGDLMESHLKPDAARRDTFELKLSKNHLSFGMPGYSVSWVDSAIPALDWSQGVVQLGHHSYNPSKDCNNCGPNTWHWDNVNITPSRPFTILRADRRYADRQNTSVAFPSPAPAGANLRFAGIGKNLEVSFDSGTTWSKAVMQNQMKTPAEEHFGSFWMPIPEGTTSVQFRGQSWFAGDWMARDISIFAR